jgi:hypothetical protein
MTRHTAKVSTNTLMELFTAETGLKTNKRVTESKLGLMERNMRATTNKDKKTVNIYRDLSIPLKI